MNRKQRHRMAMVLSRPFGDTVTGLPFHWRFGYKDFRKLIRRKKDIVKYGS